MTRDALTMPKSIDDSRMPFEEMVVLKDALRTWSNRYDLAPADMPTPAGVAILAVIREGNPLHDDELVSRAARIASELKLNTDHSALLGYVEGIQDLRKCQGEAVDAVVATAAARIRQVAHIRAAEREEANALQEATNNPTPQTREAYSDALTATNAAHTETPSRRRSLADMVKAVQQRRLASQGKKAVGIETPMFPKLSNALCGWRGFILLAAMPGIGKTTLATAAALDAVEANANTCAVFVSFEMPTETLVERTISHMSGIGQRMLRLGDGKATARIEGMQLSAQQVDNLKVAEQRLLALGDRLLLVGKSDIGTLNGRTNDMRGCMAKVERLVIETKQRSGASRSFVVLDHFGAIPVESPGGQPWPNDTERARYLLSGLVTLRDRLGEDNPIVVVAQSRKSDWKSPGLESIMGTADSGYAADAVIVFSHKNEDDYAKRKPNDIVDIVAKIDKGRDMMLRCEIEMQLDPNSSRISEVDK